MAASCHRRRFSVPSIDPSLMASSSNLVWWYSGGYKYNWCQTTNTFSNGQMVTLTREGDVSIYRPQVQFTDGSPAYPMLYGGFLELGDATLAQGNMTFAAKVTSKTMFPGTANWTQLNKRGVSGVSLAETTDGQFWLDNNQFYNDGVGDDGLPTTVNPNGTIKFKDAPGVSDVGGWLTITDSFQTYLVFKLGDPNDSNNIWVSLGIVTWDWSATESAWSLTATNVTQAIYSDSDAFPQWIHTGHNSGGH